MNIDERYNKYLSVFNSHLKSYLDSVSKEVPENLLDAIRYSVEDGGKRVRPVLCYAVADMLNVDIEEVKNFAIAVELIHSYSLIHDDLPCMDNDDYRRGKFSTHKKFGEATAVLTGDALLNLAFECCLSKDNFSEKDLSCAKLLSYFSGSRGMIKGQVLDLLYEKSQKVNEEVLEEIYQNKTTKLILAPILTPSIMSGKSYFNELNEFGKNLGMLFQISDDILDESGDILKIGKTPHKDKEEDKATSIKIFGLKGAKKMAETLYDNCINALSGIPNSDFLIDFTKKLYNRKS